MFSRNRANLNVAGDRPSSSINPSSAAALLRRPIRTRPACTSERWSDFATTAAYLKSLEGVPKAAQTNEVHSGFRSSRRRALYIGGTDTCRLVEQTEKGSTTVLTARLLLVANGLCVGQYTSPHIRNVVERISINGRIVYREELREALRIVAWAAEATGYAPT